MRNLFIIALATSLLSALSLSSQASIGITTKAGTLGAGIELTAPISAKLNTRFGINFLSFNASQYIPQSFKDKLETESNADYNLDLAFKTVAVLIDWHPWRSTFRLTSGILINQSTLKLTATSDAQFNLADESYTGNFMLLANVAFRKTAPYLGIGWGIAPQKSRRWGMGIDIGIMFQGTPDIRLTATGNATRASDNQTLDVVNDPKFQANLNTELQKIRDDKNVEIAGFFPVLSLGVQYKF